MIAQEIRRLYWDEMMPLSDIAIKLGISSRAIKRIIRENHLSLRSRSERQRLAIMMGRQDSKQINLNPNEIKELYWDEKLSLPLIARKFGCSRTPVTKVMKANGIPVRSSREGQRLTAKRGRRIQIGMVGGLSLMVIYMLKYTQIIHIM